MCPLGQEARRYVFVDLCCGSGSVSRGAEWAGFTLTYSIDTDPSQEKVTHRISVLDKPAMQRLGEDLEALRAQGYLIAMHGSPPCQQFSRAGTSSRFYRSDALNAANLRIALEIVIAVLDFMDKHADVWSLENPGTGSLWTDHIHKILHNLGKRVKLDVCQYGSLMKKNMIIAFSCSEVRDLFGEQRRCPGNSCPSKHPNPERDFKSNCHVQLDQLPLSERIAFPKQLSVHLTATMLTYLRGLPIAPMLNRRSLSQTGLVGLASIDRFYSDNTSPSAQLTGDAKQRIQSLWNGTNPDVMLQLVKLSWDLLLEDNPDTHWCSGAYIDRALTQIQQGHTAPIMQYTPHHAALEVGYIHLSTLMESMGYTHLYAAATGGLPDLVTQMRTLLAVTGEIHECDEHLHRCTTVTHTQLTSMSAKVWSLSQTPSMLICDLRNHVASLQTALGGMSEELAKLLLIPISPAAKRFIRSLLLCVATVNHSITPLRAPLCHLEWILEDLKTRVLSQKVAVKASIFLSLMMSKTHPACVAFAAVKSYGDQMSAVQTALLSGSEGENSGIAQTQLNALIRLRNIVPPLRENAVVILELLSTSLFQPPLAHGTDSEINTMQQHIPGMIRVLDLLIDEATWLIGGWLEDW